MTTTTPSTITGRLTTVGRIAVCDNYSETTYGENLDIDVISGVLIAMDDTNVRAAALLFGKPIEVRAATLSDPSTKHTTINAATFTCEGFPRPLTQADIDALYKRALDAEDHLRREVVSNQALVAEVKRLQAWCTDDATVLRLSASNDDLRAKFMAEKYLADEAAEIIKARDQTIADLQEQVDTLTRDLVQYTNEEIERGERD